MCLCKLWVDHAHQYQPADRVIACKFLFDFDEIARHLGNGVPACLLDLNNHPCVVLNPSAQEAEKAELRSGYEDHGLLFWRENGTPVSPYGLTEMFKAAVGGGGVAEDSVSRSAGAPRGAVYPGGVEGPTFGLS